MSVITDSPGRQGAPKAESAGRKTTSRQIAHARNQRGVVPMTPTHVPESKAANCSVGAKSDCVTERDKLCPNCAVYVITPSKNGRGE